MIRVLIADDHPVFRAGLRMLLAQEEDLECVGEAATAQEAVALAASARPDVAVLDLSMPGESGVWATRRIASDVAVLLLTMHDDEASVLDALRAGARGYVVKGSDEQDIVRAIRAVGRGEAIFGASVAAQVLEFAAAAPSPAARAFPELTEREREVLELLADAASNGQIAQRLGLSAKTVRNHVAIICTKLRVLDRAQAAMKARDAGLGTPG